MNHYKILAFFVFLLITCFSNDVLYAQNVGINTDGTSAHASSLLDVKSSDKGVLIPRVALTSINSASPISSPATSLMVYNTATAGTTPNKVVPGFYYWGGASWVRLMDQNEFNDTIVGIIEENAWLLNGNAGTNEGTNFIGTRDNVDLVFKTNNEERIRITDGGEIGIATDLPTQKLDVNGQIRIRGGAPGLGKVLTITVTGAEVGDVVIVNLSSNLIQNILTADLGLITLTGRVTATDTVEVLSRVTGWVNTTSSEWLVKVIK